MDPNATLIEILEAIEADDYGEAASLLCVLMSWTTKGGFKPNCQAAIETLRERMLDTPDNATGDTGTGV